MLRTERSFAKTRTTSADATPICPPMLPPVSVTRTGCVKRPAAPRSVSTPRPRRRPIRKPPRMTLGITAMPCARARRSIGMPPISSCVNAVSTSTASAKRFACAPSARAADVPPTSAARAATRIKLKTNGERENLRIELLPAEVAAMVAGNGGRPHLRRGAGGSLRAAMRSVRGARERRCRARLDGRLPPSLAQADVPRQRTAERRGDCAEELELFRVDAFVVSDRREPGLEDAPLRAGRAPGEARERGIGPEQVPHRVERRRRLAQDLAAEHGTSGAIGGERALHVVVPVGRDDGEQRRARVAGRALGPCRAGDAVTGRRDVRR